jgi:Flp pilus assembly protein protease CpaA
MIDYIIFTVTFMGLLIGSITDIKSREVPDWISYGMVFSGLGLRLLHSLVTGEWMYFVYGLIGFAVLFGLAYLMFYTGQWGGGDSKLLIAMGALFATFPTFLQEMFNPFFGKFPFMLAYWINLLIVGAVYAIIWSLVIGTIRFKDFKKKAAEKLEQKLFKQIRQFVVYPVCGILIFLALILGNIILKIVFSIMAVFILISYFMWIFVKAVEESCMYKHVKPEELTEGDWVVKDIVIDGKFICGPKTLGVEERHIRKLKELHKENKINSVLIKTGIPFIPSFFVAFIVTIVWGNFILGFILGV